MGYSNIRFKHQIQTSDSTIKQNRKHAGIYKNKVTDLQSKYTGLHVELF